MKILAIRIKNLASLAGFTEIDFTREPLKSAGIFAITGPTGAGKSTILDALCLALYGKTPRYVQARESGIEIQDSTGNKISQGDNRGILRDGTADGSAEVDFMGIDGEKYRVTWSVRRSWNKIDGAIQPDGIALINLGTGLHVPGRKTETLKEIERLVGLNFEQFTRSVLLAQGDFTAFLKADKDAKSSLLEKLTGTDIYTEISKITFEKYKEADQALKTLRDKIEDILLLSEEDLLALTEKKGELAQAIKELETELEKGKAEIAWHQTLAELVAKQETAKTALAEVREQKDNAEPGILKLTQVEGVQPARSLVRARNDTRERLAQKELAFHQLQKDIQRLTEAHQSALVKLDEANQVLHDRQAQNEAARPAIDQARELDTRIHEKTIQVSDTEKEAAKAEEKKNENDRLLEHKKAAIAAKTENNEALQKWQNDNKARQPVAENIVVICTRLEEAANLLKKHRQLSAEIEVLSIQIQKTETQIHTLTPQVNAQAEALDSKKATLELQKTALPDTAIEALRATQAQLTASHNQAIEARAAWEIYYTASMARQTTLEKLEHCQKEFIEKTSDLELKTGWLQGALVKKQQTDKLFSQAQLQFAEKVEDLRDQLTDNEPCPVCGSTHHPFVSENPQLHKVLGGLEKESQECNAQYEKLLAETGGLSSLLKKIGKERDALQNELTDTADQVMAFENKWKASKIDKAVFELASAEVPGWLQSQINTLKEQCDETSQQVDAYTKAKAALDALKEDIETSEAKIRIAQKALDDLQYQLNSQKTDSGRLAKESETINAELENLSISLNPYFDNPAWFDKWKQDPDNFGEAITSFATNWNEKTKEIATLSQSIDILTTELKGLQAQQVSLATDSLQKTTQLNAQQQFLANLKSERSEIFSGEAIPIVEEKFKKAIEEAVQAQKTLKDEEDQLNLETSNTQARMTEVEKDISGFRVDVEKCNTDIMSWMDEYNLTHESALTEESLMSLLAFSPEWIEKERLFKTTLENTLLRASHTLEERSGEVLAHETKNAPSKPLEELTNIQQETKEMLDTKTRELNEIDYTMRQDADNKKTAGKLVAEIELKKAVYENWAKLNELIGSADGKKFRQIAQEYTLDILLGFANVHLKDLSSRYKLLRIPGSLGLQVLDIDMGDEVRTVYSLSGGESFLVSLALALGLASLSSHKMKVESLFIDEGFGSLDPATLNIAMDALERLHNQGRKVGVISHVQEMTDRIPTRIKVSKLSSGKSKTEVESALY